MGGTENSTYNRVLSTSFVLSSFWMFLFCSQYLIKMGVFTYCQWMSPKWILKANAFPAARLVTSFLLFASLKSEMFEYPEQAFCIINPFLWCELTQLRFMERMVFLPKPGWTRWWWWVPLAKELIPAAKDGFFLVADCTCEVVRSRWTALWRCGGRAVSVTCGWALLWALHHFNGSREGWWSNCPANSRAPLLFWNSSSLWNSRDSLTSIEHAARYRSESRSRFLILTALRGKCAAISL